MNNPYRELAPISGWNEGREADFTEFRSQGLVPGRIVAANRERYRLSTEAGEFPARLSGRLHLSISGGEETRPVIGDWTAAFIIDSVAIIQAVLPRVSFFSRRAAGPEVDEQVLAANIDLLFIVMGLDGDFNLNRLDRYLVLARHGGTMPVVVLTKADLVRDVSSHMARTSSQIVDVPVHAVSNVTRAGIAELTRYLQPSTTFLLVGSSGAGKSTLTNLLVGKDVARTGEVSRGNGKGRATTTSGRVFETSSGALLIDSPGLRELRLWGEEEDLGGAFSDVKGLEAHCKFRDCAHNSEPGCAVRQAMLEGALAPEHYRNYLKLENELHDTKEGLLRKKRERFKKIAVAIRQQKRWRDE